MTPPKEAEYLGKRFIHLAKKYAKTHDCPKCHTKERKVVPLHEYGDPFIPSTIVLYCVHCQFKEVYAHLPEENARAYATEIKEERERLDKLGFVKVGPEFLDKLIVTQHKKPNKKAPFKKK